MRLAAIEFIVIFPYILARGHQLKTGRMKMIQKNYHDAFEIHSSFCTNCTVF